MTFEDLNIKLRTEEGMSDLNIQVSDCSNRLWLNLQIIRQGSNYIFLVLRVRERLD